MHGPRRKQTPGGSADSLGGGGSLAVDDIVAAALRVGISQGFGALTMRALARELGTSAMAAYHHVSNKEALVDLVLDHVLAPVEVPAADSGAWAERLLELERRSAAALQAWPGLDALTFDRAPTDQGWRLMNGYLQILLDAGFTPRNAVLAFGIIHSYGVGRATNERRMPGHGGVSRAAGRQEWSALREVAGQWSQLQQPETHRFADQVIIDGLLALLAKQQCEDSDSDSEETTASATTT
jgi:AcrR family transcriptional regulator